MDSKFESEWKEVKLILEETATPFFEDSARVLLLMSCIEKKDLEPILKSLRRIARLFPSSESGCDVQMKNPSSQ